MNITEKAKRAARKRNQCHVERWPLLEISGDLHHYTGDEILAEWERYQAKLDASNIRLAARAESFRLRVAALVSTEELARLDVQRLMYPPASCYSADFWRSQLEQLGKETADEIHI